MFLVLSAAGVREKAREVDVNTPELGLVIVGYSVQVPTVDPFIEVQKVQCEPPAGQPERRPPQLSRRRGGGDRRAARGEDLPFPRVVGQSAAASSSSGATSS